MLEDFQDRARDRATCGSVECSIMLVTGEEKNPIMYLTQHRGYREISYTGRLGREGWVAGDIEQQRRLCRLSFYNLFRKIQVGNK